VAVGPEFQVNTFTPNSQSSPSIASDDAGNIVVVWRSMDQDGSGFGIFGQRFNNAGVAQGNEFQINTTTAGSQGNIWGSTVAMDADGDFVVIWEGSDGDSAGVFGQRYSANGVPQGGEFLANSSTTGYQGRCSVAMDSDGDFVIAWETGGGAVEVFARQFSSSGTPAGNEFQVNQYTDNFQNFPSVAMDSAGNFVVAWTSRGQDGGGVSGVFARRYTHLGAPIGNEFQVNTFTTERQQQPVVAMDVDGDFVVAWESVGQDGSSYGIYAQRYANSGLPAGNEFQVNSYTSGTQRIKSVAMDAAGSFIISWGGPAYGETTFDAYARHYTASGIPVSDEFRVNTFTADIQSVPVVAMAADAQAIIAWGSVGQDGSSFGIFGQRFVTRGLEIAAIQVNGGSAQRSRVTSLSTTFNTVVSFTGPTAAAFRLTRQGGGDVGGFTATSQTVGGATVVTLNGFTGAQTESGSLADGVYTLTVFANQVTDAFGQFLDGNGDGTPGDNYVSPTTGPNRIHRLFGDSDGDGDADGLDFAALRLAFAVGNTLAFDADGDGQLTAADVAAFRERFGSVVP